MIIREVIQTIEKNKLFSIEDKILIALSGGADSVALFRILQGNGYKIETLHCNFHLRGEESERDELFVKKLCKQFNVKLHITHFDTKKYAKDHHISIEMAARELRYEWFEQKRKEQNAKVIATAHHLDDSVETVLLNLIRGTGINGLKGISPKRETIVRPLINLTRKKIINYLSAINQEYVIDSTNLEDNYVRNNLRLNILPLMEEINPSVKQSISRTTSHLIDIEKIYRKEIDNSIKRVRDNRGIVIESLLSEVSPKAVLFEILNPLGFNFIQIEEIIESISRQSGKIFLSPEWRLVKDRTHLLLDPLKDLCGKTERILKIDKEGSYDLGNNKKLYVRLISASVDFQLNKSKSFAFFDAEKVEFPLLVRKWKKGDSFVPFGMKGNKKVSDLLTDLKISVVDKELIDVVLSNNKIIWVVGERSDNRFRITEKTKKILELRVL